MRLLSVEDAWQDKSEEKYEEEEEKSELKRLQKQRPAVEKPKKVMKCIKPNSRFCCYMLKVVKWVAHN